MKFKLNYMHGRFPYKNFEIKVMKGEELLTTDYMHEKFELSKLTQQNFKDSVESRVTDDFETMSDSSLDYYHYFKKTFDAEAHLMAKDKFALATND